MTKKLSYYQRNKNRIAKYYQYNKEEIKRKEKIYRKNNVDKIKKRKKIYAKKYYLKNKYKISKKRKELYFKNNNGKKRVKKGRMLRAGIRQADKIRILKKQNYKCLICDKTIILKTARADHCHKKNKFRGILCNSCNFGIGFLKDNISILKNAIEYLKQK